MISKTIQNVLTITIHLLHVQKTPTLDTAAHAGHSQLDYNCSQMIGPDG